MNSNNQNSKEVLIELKNLTKRFGSFTAVSNLNFKIYEGEIFGYLGPNGAGKSTTMKMIANLLKPSDGEVWIRDKDKKLKQLNNKTEDILLDNIGFLIEVPAFYEDMTPRQILRYFAKLKGYSRGNISDRVEEVITKVKNISSETGLNPDIIENIYRAMIDSFIKSEMDEFNKREN